ncbi:MAG: diguanylate cyclase domain-containing protein [Phycisphaerae bacterium]
MPVQRNSFGRDSSSLILVIDDAEDSIRLVADLVQKAGFCVITAQDGPGGIAMAEHYLPQAILVDLCMPDMDGFEVCAELKSRIPTADIPVIFVTGSEPTDELIQQCYDAGADDVLFKPIRKVHLIARLRVLFREMSVRDAYRRLATQDQVTGLDNRRQTFLNILDAIMTSDREKTESILVLGDVDGLAVLNARYGYDFGDEIILTFARLLKRYASPTCKPGRVAGDTLALVIKRWSSRQQAADLCRRLSQTFSAIAFDADEEPKHFTASFGLAAYAGDRQNMDADLFMSEADIALFEAKELHRGRVCAYWDLDPNALPVIAPEKRHARRKARRRSNRAFVGVVEPPSSRPSPPSLTDSH